MGTCITNIAFLLVLNLSQIAFLLLHDEFVIESVEFLLRFMPAA
jgi:hypothetical protein